MSEPFRTFTASELRRRLLIVEDEPINQEILQFFLEDSYDLTIAGTCGEGLAALEDRSSPLSLILLDLNLPDMYGLELLRRVRADASLSRIPVIVMTADSDAEVECLTLGAVDFIPKPYPQQSVVLARIRRTIELYEDRDTIQRTERDSLTGLYNKEFFYRYAVQLDSFHRSFPTDAIVLNVNHFHIINERYGRSRGDELLRRIGAELLELVQRFGGIAGRSEADAFMVYCPHQEDHSVLLEQLCRNLEEKRSNEACARLRMGVYADVDKTVDIERRFDRAKLAADRVRGSFNRSIGVYDDSLRESELMNEQLIEDFPAAIRERQFLVYFQPKFNVSGPEPVLSSAEALVRWKHPRLGMISPGVFIPLFENNGLVQTLDEYVWRRTAARIRDWKQRLGISLPVSVNVSRVDMYDQDLVEKLRRLVSEHGLDYRELLLEVTESAYTEDSEQIIGKVRQLRELGFRIEMDDFGSGYSSLNMLSAMPIDALKLDMVFVRNAFRGRKDTRLLEVMIQLAERFQVPTIAEGVETEEQMYTLKTLGCDVIQGYYFSRPLPAEEFERFLCEHLGDGAARPGTDCDALHDPLTGLYNGSAFEIMFNSASADHVAVLLAEPEGLDALRQSYGDETADRVLRRIADVLRRSFRIGDNLFCLENSQFLVVMSHASESISELILEKLDAVCRQLQTPEGSLPPIRLRSGVAFSGSGMLGEEVFRRAEEALERAKADTTGPVALY